MGVPPTPFDPDASAAGSASTTSSIDIWDLGDYGLAPVTIGSAGKNRTGFGGYNKLDPWDQARASRPSPGSGTAVIESIADLMKKFAAMAYSPKGEKEFLSWQQALYGAGLYGNAKPSDVAWGSFDDRTEAALKSALVKTAQTNEAGAPISLSEYLDKLKRDRERASKEFGDSGPSVVAETTSPKVVAGVLQQAAQAALGKNLSKDDVDHFVSEYIAAERAYFGRKTEADDPGLNVVEGQPDVQAEAQEFVTSRHGVEASGNQMADYVGVLSSLLGGD